MQVIKRSIQIQATADKIWQVFVNPNVTKDMGGEYVSDWREGVLSAGKVFPEI